MKFRLKMTLCMLSVLSLLFGAGGSLLISGFFQDSLEREKDAAFSSYRMAWSTRGSAAGQAGAILGWLPLAGSMCIALGYAVIIAYVLKALTSSLTGALMTVVYSMAPRRDRFSTIWAMELVFWPMAT